VSAPASTRYATFVLLLAGGCVALLYALRLAAAALGWGFSPFTYVYLPEDQGTVAWLLAAAVVALGLLVWLVLRHGEATVWLPRDGGGVLVPVAPLQRLVEQAAARHPEVVRAEADIKATGGRLGGVVRIYGRPLADPVRLAAEVEPLVVRRLFVIAGADPAAVAVRPRILKVSELKKYLP
jgi:hypothetical protein